MSDQSKSHNTNSKMDAKGAENTFKNIFDNSSDLIYIHDEKGVFIDVNKAVIEKYGYSKDEIVGNTAVIFSAPDMNDFAEVANKVESVWNGGPPQTMEWWSMKKDKTIFLKELILRKGVYFGKDVIIATGRDITERKETETKLIEKNEELKKLNAALDAFVYSASHDLKAPLSSVKGLIHLLQTDNDVNPHEYLKKMEASVDKLIAFVNDLVEYSRNARTTLKSEEIDFKQIVQDILNDFEFLPDYNGVKIEKNIDDIEGFYCDTYRVSVILNNLISNALRYSDADKVDPYINIGIQAQNDEVHITVADNGIGINPSHGNQIFDMFYRATDVKTGSGLGLFIVKETVTKLGGTVQFSSKEGEGTTFTVRLPYQEH